MPRIAKASGRRRIWPAAPASRRSTAIGPSARSHGVMSAQLTGRVRTPRRRRAQLERISDKSSLADAIRHAPRHIDGLGLSLDDGRVERDTNTVGRSIRSVALGRKDSLFADSDGGAGHRAIAASPIDTAKLHPTEPFTDRNDVLDRVVTGRTKAHQREDPLPWQRRPTSTVNP
jgi:hypothetical protein